MDESIKHECCDAFRKALERGTDNEGYGPLVYRDDGSIKIGYYKLQPIRFCPWCGASIQQNEPGEFMRRFDDAVVEAWLHNREPR